MKYTNVSLPIDVTCVLKTNFFSGFLGMWTFFDEDRRGAKYVTNPLGPPLARLNDGPQSRVAPPLPFPGTSSMVVSGSPKRW